MQKLASILSGCLLLAATAPQTQAAAVTLQMPTATFSQTSLGDFSIAKTVDGIVNDNYGWAIQGGISNQTAVWETSTDIGNPAGTLLTFTLIQNGSWFNNRELLGRFRLSVTTDPRSTFADGLSTGGDVTANWTALDPISFSALNDTSLSELPDHSLLAAAGTAITDTYTVQAVTTLMNLTGVRLEVLQDSSLPFNGPGLEPGNGNFILSEFKMDAAVVPEPGSCLLLLVAGLVFAGRKLPRRH